MVYNRLVSGLREINSGCVTGGVGIKPRTIKALNDFCGYPQLTDTTGGDSERVFAKNPLGLKATFRFRPRNLWPLLQIPRPVIL